MFSYFLPRHIRQGRQLLKDARKMLAYKRDLWSAATISEYENNLGKLDSALRQRDQPAIEESAHALDALCTANLPPPKDAAMRENVEVFLVAIVIALGVRTYFLQPFTIPTGSMQPTLNGVIGYRTTEPPPNPLVQVVDFAVHGRNWLNVVAEEGEEVIGVEEFKSLGFGTRFGFLIRTEIKTTKGTHVVPAMRETILRYFLMDAMGRTYHAGEPIARGYIDTGDHVFVDKVSYHFRKPQRADVFVFNTLNVPTNENRLHPDGPSQFYIKRLGGTPGDELRIATPELFINGKLAEDERFRRVMSRQSGYGGYCNGREVGFTSGIMSEPDIPFRVPEKNYFALGDNSYHSSDSRDWGPVPEQNLMGRGVFVYWPFLRHWGLIH